MPRIFTRLMQFALVVLLASAAGCLVIEKKTLIMVLPADSKEIHLQYVFEGLSRLDDQNSNIGEAVKQMKGLERNDIAFFAQGVATDPDNPAMKNFAFGKLRWYSDPSRTRRLCAERRATIKDRDALEDEINQWLRREIERTRDVDHAVFQANVQMLLDQLAKPEAKEIIDGFGMRALAKSATGLLKIAKEFDAESLKRLRKAPEKYRWLRIEPDQIRLVLPIDQPNAQRIRDAAATELWVREMRDLVQPLRITASAEGLALVLGAPGTSIRFAIDDPRPFMAGEENAMAQLVGDPGPIRVDGNDATAKTLIDEFLREHGKK